MEIFFRKPPNFVPEIKSCYLGFFFISFTKQNKKPYLYSVSNTAKNVVRKCFSQFYLSEVQRQLAAGV